MRSPRPVSTVRNRSAVALLLAAAILGIVPWQITARAVGNDPADANAIDSSNSTIEKAGVGSDQKINGSVFVASDSEEPKNAGELLGQIFVDASFHRSSDKRVSTIVRIDPNTGNWEPLNQTGTCVRVSPDRSLIAYEKNNGTWVCDPNTGANAHALSDVAGRPVWSPDSQQLMLSDGKTNEEDKKDKPERPVWTVETWKFNRDGANKALVPVPNTDFVEDWSPDGKWLLTSSDRQAPFGSGYQLYLMSVDATTQTRLTQGKGLNVFSRFSPDGKRVVYVHQERGRNSVRTIDVDGSHATEIIGDDGLKKIDMACWAPDGIHLAVLWRNWKLDADGKETLSADDLAAADFRLEILTLGGKKIRTLRLKDAELTWLGLACWK